MPENTNRIASPQPDTDSLPLSALEATFQEPRAAGVRKWLMEQVTFTESPYPYTRAAYAVVNPIDYCPVGCPHCMFSSLKRPAAADIAISGAQTDVLAGLLSDAVVRELVLTGGGEPFENTAAMFRLVSEATCLEHVVVITSAYFAETPAAAAEMLERLRQMATGRRRERGLDPVQITLRISRDDSYMRTVPLTNILYVIDYVRRHSDVFRLIIRTLMADEGHEDQRLAALLGGELLPGLGQLPPALDGLHTRWIRSAGHPDIPVIYKPAYFTGRGQRGVNRQRRGPGSSVWDVVRDEAQAGTPLNLAIRGPRGEGHDYYQNLLEGYHYWSGQLGGKDFISPKSHVQKELALFVSASGEISINSGVPDLHYPLLCLAGWQDFLARSFSDPLQHFLVREGPMAALAIAEEVEPDVRRRISETNFVFSISLYSLATAPLRLYCELRVMSRLLQSGAIMVNHPLARKLINTDADLLRKGYWNARDISAGTDIRLADPIRGGAPSIEDTTPAPPCLTAAGADGPAPAGVRLS
jgi:hypothetical protein